MNHIAKQLILSLFTHVYTEPLSESYIYHKPYRRIHAPCGNLLRFAIEDSTSMVDLPKDGDFP